MATKHDGAYDVCDHANGYCAYEIDNQFRSAQKQANEEIAGYADAEWGRPKDMVVWRVSVNYRQGYLAYQQERAEEIAAQKGA